MFLGINLVIIVLIIELFIYLLISHSRMRKKAKKPNKLVTKMTMNPHLKKKKIALWTKLTSRSKNPRQWHNIR